MRTSEFGYKQYKGGGPVGMKPLSERDENSEFGYKQYKGGGPVGMKPLSERDENSSTAPVFRGAIFICRNEATL